MPLAASKIFLCFLRAGTLLLILILDLQCFLDIFGVATADDGSGFHVALASLGLFGQDVVAESAFANELAGAGDLDAFGGTFVGFKFWHSLPFLL